MTTSSNDPYSIHRAEASPGSSSALATAIGDHPFLKGLSVEQVDVLSANAMPVEFPANEIIFHEGDAANRFYLILSGVVALESADSNDNKPVEIERIGAEDVLGWSWMFPPFYWRFTARAIEPTKAIFFYGTRLRDECERDPKLGMLLSQRAGEVAIHRLQATRKKLIDMQRTRG